MSDEKKYTERELVMAKRNAFYDGANWASSSGSWVGAADEAKRRFPLPRRIVPRVVKESSGLYGDVEWRSVGGALEWCKDGRQWRSANNDNKSGMFITPHRVVLLAELLANPTMEIDDEG